MNEVMENMRKRRSVRKYQPRQVEREVLEEILAAGYTAPNAGNRQQLRMVVCQNPEVNDHVGKAHSILIGKFNRFGPKNFYFTDADGYIFAQNVCLAAKSLGVGSCIVGEVLDAFSDDFGRGLLQKWGIPETHRSVAFVTLGYSAEGEKSARSNRYAAPVWVG